MDAELSTYWTDGVQHTSWRCGECGRKHGTQGKADQCCAQKEQVMKKDGLRGFDLLELIRIHNRASHMAKYTPNKGWRDDYVKLAEAASSLKERTEKAMVKESP